MHLTDSFTPKLVSVLHPPSCILLIHLSKLFQQTQMCPLVNYVAKWQLIPSQTDLVTLLLASPPLLPPTLTLIPCSFSLTSYSWWVPFPILLKLYVLLRSPSVCLSSAWKSHIHVSLSHSQSSAAAVILSNKMSPPKKKTHTELATEWVAFDQHSCTSKQNKDNQLCTTISIHFILLTATRQYSCIWPTKTESSNSTVK